MPLHEYIYVVERTGKFPEIRGKKSHWANMICDAVVEKQREINLERASTKQRVDLLCAGDDLTIKRNAGQSDGRQTNRLSSRSRSGRVQQRHNNACMAGAGPQKENNEDAKSLELSSPHGHGQRIPRVRISSSSCFAAPSSSTEGIREIM